MAKIDEAAALLLRVREGAEPPPQSFPPELAPADVGQAYAIQHEVTAELGAIGGWKVLPAREGEPTLCAAVPISYLRAPGARLDLRDAEAQIRVVIAARLAVSMARENVPFTRSEAEAAIATIHPAVELLAPRLGPEPLDHLAYLADSLAAGPLVIGHATQTWHGFDPTKLAVSVRINNKATRYTGRAEFDLPGVLVWLAASAATWWDGPLVGQFIEIGLGIAPLRVTPRSQVHVAIEGLGQLELALT